MDCMGGAQRFCKGCMERCIMDPFHIKMRVLVVKKLTARGKVSVH